MTHYEPTFYDPMGTQNITSAICQELERQPLIPLDPPIERFDGSGLYAIYFSGAASNLYAPLSGTKIPVYVGQALSHNSATGAATRSRSPLWSRTRIHLRSIADADDLDLADFGIRLLMLPDVHSDLGENGLRVFYQPLWNGVLNGFGSNEQGPSTRQSSRSRWDTVHIGRNRTFGAERWDRESLIAEAHAHIKSQLENYAAAPWRRAEVE